MNVEPFPGPLSALMAPSCLRQSFCIWQAPCRFHRFSSQGRIQVGSIYNLVNWFFKFQDLRLFNSSPLRGGFRWGLFI